MNPSQDVVLAVGPPFSGKTVYYNHELSHSHMRVSTAEIYRSDPNANLRIIIQKIVAELRKGHNVVVDDDNLVQRQTRLSYITGISKKVPGCKFSCLQFMPQHGTTQLHLCHEWNLAQRALDILQSLPSGPIRFSRVHQTAAQIDSSISLMQDVPLDWDKYDTATIHTPLFCSSSHELSSPLLLVQWEGMVDSAKAIRRGVAEALQKWCSVNTAGHVVIVCDGRKGSDMMRTEVFELLSPLIEQFSTCHPIHFITMEDPSAFGCPPSTGLLAWIQYMFTAALQHKSSLYIYHTKSHQTCAEQMGMRHILAFKVFSRPQTVNTVHFTEHEPSNFLHCITYLNPQSCPKRKMPVSGQRHLPLASLAKLLEESLHKQNYAHANYDITTSVYTVEYGTAANSGMKQVSAYAGGGRILGMVYRSLGEVEHFQQHYMDTLAVVTNMRLDFVLAAPKEEPAHDDVQMTDQPTCRGGPITTQAIQEYALNPTMYACGTECQSSIYALEINRTPDGMWRIHCKCKGSSDTPYIVSAAITDSGGASHSLCTCKAGERNVRCKHVIAMLLVHMRRQNSEDIFKVQEKVKSVAASQSTRSLPKWIQESSQEAIVDGKKKHNRKVNESSFKLTEMELMKTALEVVQMHSSCHQLNDDLMMDSLHEVTADRSSTRVVAIELLPNQETNEAVKPTVDTEGGALDDSSRVPGPL